MAKRAKGKRSGKRSKKAAAAASVRIRFANEGKMAKRKGGGGKKRSGGRKRNPGRGRKSPHRRRRRNPETFMGALGHLAAAGLVAVGTGALVLMAQSKWAQPNASTGQPNNLALYGIPLVGVVGAAAIAKKAPTLAVGMATGAIAGPFAMPLFSKVSSAQQSSASTAAATHAALSAVELGALGWTGGNYPQRMASVHADNYS